MKKQPRLIWAKFLKKLSANRKLLLVYAGLMLFLFLALALLAFISQRTAGIKLLQVVLVLALGLFHVRNMNRRLLFIDDTVAAEPLLVTLALALAGCMLAVVLYLFTGVSIVLAPVLACAFVTPCLLIMAWQAFEAIPKKEYKSWSLQETHTGDELNVLVQHDIEVKIELRGKSLPKSKVYSLLVPRQRKLGEVFTALVKDPQAFAVQDLEDMDYSTHYRWNFYIEELWGLKKHFLDPGRSLRQNAVKENTLIIVQEL